MTDVQAKPRATRNVPSEPIAALLTPEGVLSAEGERLTGVSDEQLRQLYRLMVVCRRLDQEALNLQRQGELGLWGPIAGHEAAQVGAACAMMPEDWIFPYYRNFGIAIARGVDPGTLMKWYRGLTHVTWNPLEHHLAPGIIMVGAVVPHAVGFAMGCALDGERVAVLVSFGDGATSTGDWHEGMNFAGVFNAPVVFFCENNQWALSVPLREQVAGRVADRAAGYGFPGVRIDGTDALTVYATVRVAADRARRGEGPYLIEAVTYRMGPHTNSDDPTRYRTEADVAPWRAKDPIQQCAERLRARGAWDERFEAEVRADADERAADMRRTLLAAQPEHPAHIFDLVFENPPGALRRERDEFIASLEAGGDA
jgi:2-oxoisovalerate dehydrogenase E1 component alpha subunit